MGQKGSKPTKEQEQFSEQEKLRDQKIKEELARAQMADQKIHKLLLLGAGESGKSTLFKQIQTIYGDGITDDDLRSCIPHVFQNVVQAMHDLADHVDDILDENGEPHRVKQSNLDAQDFYRQINCQGSEFTQQYADYAKQLWSDPAIQIVWEHRQQFHIPESTKYFLDQIDTLANPEYHPSHEDFLRIRVRTTGIVQKQFEIDKNKFHLFDVGGQRNERKKWIHCFEGVTAVIFVAAISEYDQLLFEDDKTNRLLEAIKLFDEMINNKYFSNTSMLLFLNKSDLFEQKIQTIPLKKFFPKYPGTEKNSDEAKQWICEQFQRRNKNTQKLIYVHTTCATDGSNVKKVFTMVKDVLIRGSLADAGLLN